MVMIGRKAEKQTLQRVLDRKSAQIVVVYGRRRVGKTFLVNEYFGNRYAFKHTAVSPAGTEASSGKMRIQLTEFFYSLKTYGLKPDTKCPETWAEAFHLLQELLDARADGSNQVIFIDELPWMDTPRSGFVSAFEHFCNDWCSARKHVKLIVCGSATSWICDEMLESKGGLYDRVTASIYVRPFTLRECEEFFREEGFNMDRYDVVQAYMAFGGIPYYLSQFREDLSVVQNIDALIFDRDSILYDEFDRLFSSQFANPEVLKSIVTAAAGKRCGLTREEIASKLGKLAGGTFSTSLKALEKSRFIVSYKPFGEKTLKYRVSDQFCSFYLHYAKANRTQKNFWQMHYGSPAMNSWLGYAFEEIVFGHIDQVKQALGIAGVCTSESAWSVEGTSTKEGMQIDLLIDRADRVVDVCEIKFSRDEYTVNAAYARKILARLEQTSSHFKSRRSVSSVLITTYGLKKNEYSGRFQKVITLDDLFR
jgi:AAA+ ATPase superfamily predicted ATPase